MKIKYKTNFAGYIPVLRSIQMLLKDHILTFTQLGAFICFVSQADFDHRHPNFTVIIRDDYQLAQEWGCSPSTVHRRRKELIDKGLLYENDGITRVTNFTLFQLDWVKSAFAKLPPAIVKSFYAKSIDEVAKDVDSIAQTLETLPQESPQSSNVPFKGNVGLSNSEYIDNDLVSREIDKKKNEIDEKKIGGDSNDY